TLHDVVRAMDEPGYTCFWITPRALVPLWGKWWSEWYEVMDWIMSSARVSMMQMPN
ncbi:hypothetical protein M427DRAFT_52351, partial [Gonapodya prolifera JEL478]